MPDLSELARAVVPYVGVFGAVVAANGLGKLWSGWWTRTLGRRRHWKRQYRKLAPHVRIEYVQQLFGESTYEIRHEGEIPRIYQLDPNDEPRSVVCVERIWVLVGAGYLQVLANEHGSVTGYSLTTKNRRFRPRIRIGSLPGQRPRFTVKLGKTRFSELPVDSSVYRFIGARTYEYRESFYFGNPGGYVEWICTHNQVGCNPEVPLMDDVPDPPWYGGEVAEWRASLTEEQRADHDRTRQGTVVNTVSVVADSLLTYRTFNLLHSGPELDLVRTMPIHEPWVGGRLAHWTNSRTMYNKDGTPRRFRRFR